MDRVGVGVSCGVDTIEVDGSALFEGGYRAIDVETAPYPGLPTDLQPPTAVLLTQATGSSHVHEAIFEDRLEWLSEVRRMGARIDMPDGHHATIDGPGSACRRGGRDRRPASGRLAHPGRPRGRRDDRHPRCAPRSPGL